MAKFTCIFQHAIESEKEVDSVRCITDGDITFIFNPTHYLTIVGFVALVKCDLYIRFRKVRSLYTFNIT